MYVRKRVATFAWSSLDLNFPTSYIYYAPVKNVSNPWSIAITIRGEIIPFFISSPLISLLTLKNPRHRSKMDPQWIEQPNRLSTFEPKRRRDESTFKIEFSTPLSVNSIILEISAVEKIFFFSTGGIIIIIIMGRNEGSILSRIAITGRGWNGTAGGFSLLRSWWKLLLQAALCRYQPSFPLSFSPFPSPAFVTTAHLFHKAVILWGEKKLLRDRIRILYVWREIR